MCSDKCPCPEKDVKDKYAALYKTDAGKKRFEAAKRYIDDGSTPPSGMK